MGLLKGESISIADDPLISGVLDGDEVLSGCSAFGEGELLCCGSMLKVEEVFLRLWMSKSINVSEILRSSPFLLCGTEPSDSVFITCKS